MTDDANLGDASGDARSSASAVSPGPQTPPTRRAGTFVVPKAWPIVLGAALLITLASAGVFLAKKQLRNDVPETRSAAPVTLDLSTTEASAPSSPHAVEGLPANKILNSGAEAMKAAADELGDGLHSAPGTVNELPAAPGGGGNEALQGAAKEAGKRFAPKSDAGDDLSTSESSSAETEQQNDFVNPAVAAAISNARLADEVAGLKQALQSDLSKLTENLSEERQRAADQAEEIARLEAELQRLRLGGAQDAARAAVVLDQLAAKARSGAPFRRELDAYFAMRPEAPPDPALDLYADKGLPTAQSLKLAFPAVRDAALKASRKEAANDLIARLGANLAGLVRLRPARPLKGASAAAVISRAEALVEAGDVVGAVAELGGLTGAARAAFSPWIADASARIAGERALAGASDRLLGDLKDGAGR